MLTFWPPWLTGRILLTRRAASPLLVLCLVWLLLPSQSFSLLTICSVINKLYVKLLSQVARVWYKKKKKKISQNWPFNGASRQRYLLWGSAFVSQTTVEEGGGGAGGGGEEANKWLNTSTHSSLDHYRTGQMTSQCNGSFFLLRQMYIKCIHLCYFYLSFCFFLRRVSRSICSFHQETVNRTLPPPPPPSNVWRRTWLICYSLAFFRGEKWPHFPPSYFPQHASTSLYKE